MRKAVSLLPLALLLSTCDNPTRPNLGQTPNDAGRAALITTDLTGVRAVLTYTEHNSRTPLPPSATGAVYWIEGALRAGAGPGVVVKLGRIEDEKTVYGIALGTYDVVVGYGPNTYPLGLPRRVSVQVLANQTTPVTVELGEVLGVIAGTLTLNQAPPGDGLVLCTYTGTGASGTTSPLLWCTPLAADGSFRQLLPAVDGRGRPAADGHGLVCSATAVNAQGCPNPIASFAYRVEAGRTVVLPPLNVGTAGVRVVLTYTDRDSHTPLPPSATGAAYWIEGALCPVSGAPLCSTPGVRVNLGRIEDEKTLYAVALRTYDVDVAYGPRSPPYPLQLPHRVSVAVVANQTTPVTVELGEVLGVMAGTLTLNQAPPGDGLVLCTYIGLTTGHLLWCTPLAADGGFRQLLPAGAGRGLVCFAAAVDARLGCPDPVRFPKATIASFTYQVLAGRTVVLPPLNVGGAATQLAFTVQPSTTTAGAAISPAVRVTARDAFGNTFTGFGGTVTLGFASKSGGTLSGTTTMAAVAGVATFSDLHIDRAGTGYTLAAMAEGLTMATSTPFDIVAGAATQLAFTVQPSTATVEATISPAVQVTAWDAFGNTSTGFGGTVTLGLASRQGKLGGTTTMAAVAGVATFSDLFIHGAASVYTLSATAVGLTMATSTPFDVVAGAATQLDFAVQPSTTTAGAAISPAVQIVARDAFGNTSSGFGGTVTLGLLKGGPLSGTTTVAAVAGVATFSDLSIDRPGRYTLAATAVGLTMATSTPFDITVPPLNWVPQASGTPNTLYGVWGASGSDVFAVGVNGTIVHYDGTNWAAQTSGTANPLYGVWGMSGNDVFAVGSYGGTIVHYDGASWATQTSGTPDSLYGVWGTSGSDVFAVGYGGAILHYDGTSWAAQASGTTSWLTGVWGTSGSDVFAVGRDGTILHYDGTSWAAQASGTASWLTGVWGAGTGGNVFAVGGDGTILHYNGYGTNWTPQTSGTTQFLYGVWGANGADVFAVGDLGTILHFDGTNWAPQTSGTPSAYLRGVWGSSGSNVFVVGPGDGAVLHGTR